MNANVADLKATRAVTIPPRAIALNATIVPFRVPTSRCEVTAWASAGAGRPVLVLEGPGTDALLFARLLAFGLGDTYRLIRFTLPDALALDVPGHADLALEVIEQLGLDDVAVIGSQAGAQAALELTGLASEVAGVLAISPNLRSDMAHPAMAATLAAAQLHASVVLVDDEGAFSGEPVLLGSVTTRHDDLAAAFLASLEGREPPRRPLFYSA